MEVKEKIYYILGRISCFLGKHTIAIFYMTSCKTYYIKCYCGILKHENGITTNTKTGEKYD